MTLLIDKDTFFNDSRFVDKNTNFELKISSVVVEVQQVEIKPQIGDEFLIQLLDYVNSEDAEANIFIDKLLCGGTYLTTNGSFYLEGLNKAISYYVYAYLLRSQNSYMGVNGLRHANDTTSSLADYKEKENTYNQVKKIAESYMADCMKYIHIHCEELKYRRCQTKKRKQNLRII